MKTNHWMKVGMIAVLTVLSVACGRGGQVAGRTYVATGASGYGQYGYNTGYNTGYYGGYNYGYNGYNNGYNYGYNNGYNTGYNAQGTGDTIAFDNNMRATYRQVSTGQSMAGTYSFLDSSNQSLVFRPDGVQGTTGVNTMVGVQEMRFTVSNDGSTITNQTNGQVMYRQ